MKKMIISFVLIFSFSTIEAQIKTPMILDTIWVKDAIGNIDSVFIGADSAATSNIDPEFGEIELIHPFDSIFEVRTMAFLSRKRELSKINIEEAYKRSNSNDQCYRARLFNILIVAKHQPVTVYWNRPHFENTPCENGSFITDHYVDELVQAFDWNRDTLKKCMAVEDSLIIDTSIPNPIKTEFEIEGKGKQPIYGVRIDIIPWCPEGIIGSAEDSVIPILKTFPNPTSDILYIDSEFPKLANVYDLQGKLVLKSVNTSKIDVSQLVSGVYFLEVIDRNRVRQVSKFIKM